MDLNWMQRYAATELAERSDTGMMDRREALTRLGRIFGSSTAAAAFLAACSSGGSNEQSIRRPKPSSSTRAPVSPPTVGGAGHLLAVPADDPAIAAKDVQFDGPASEMFGYLAVPTAPGRYPGIIVIHEIFGINDHIRDVARRLAKVGYVAIAPDLVSRAGGTERAPDVIAALISGPLQDRVADLNATGNYLDTVDAFNGRLGVTGFCFGGGMTLAFAAAQPKVVAAVSYYGPTPEPASMMRATNAAVLAQYGADDARVNAGIPALTAAMTGKTFETRIWPGVGHQFNNDTSPAYDEAVAVDAWTAALRWFDRYLRPPGASLR